MVGKQIGILEPELFSEKAIRELAKAGCVSCYNTGSLDEFLANKQILFIRLTYQIDEDFLAKAPLLEFICSPTTGLNHLDLRILQEKNVRVISLKGEQKFLSHIRATPEHIFGLTIALLRNYKGAFLSEGNHLWNRDKYRGTEIYGKQVGIIGYGRIGRILSKYFKAFGATTYYYDTNPLIKSSFGCLQADTLEDLIKISDIIILSASYSEDNIRLISGRYLDLLKDKFFINAARGELVDEEGLLDKIEKGMMKGVAIDVLTNETKDNNLDRFLKLSRDRNLIVTPHIGGATFESMHKTEVFIVEKLLKVLQLRGG